MTIHDRKGIADPALDSQLPPIEAALGSLAEPAPARLAHRTLVAVGLADDYAVIESPLGPLRVAWNGRGVSTVELAEDDHAFELGFFARTGRRAMRQPELPARLGQAIERRLAGDRRARIDLDLRGHSEFERAVWLKALEIPRGEVRPYGWIAAEIGRPKAVRAVGTALGHNPVPLIVPCHRVVRSDGTIGQYSLGGAENKRTILSAEGLDPDELEGLARAGIRYVGSDTTRIFCLPTCRHARRVTERHRVEFRSAAASRAAGYRACKICRPSVADVAA
ncbi:MAG TPA: methylated-DNA--[protein]-cysteine S-methyltransferase [Candidatus Limnocylindrales bacterium]|jgi:O-6-methylguanine DNA methyltransferase|nr:methylated-DNA--[protein]-cysteine S-methyltransferase [Candidatus Limnocylindrales bacterium]